MNLLHGDEQSLRAQAPLAGECIVLHGLDGCCWITFSGRSTAVNWDKVLLAKEEEEDEMNTKCPDESTGEQDGEDGEGAKECKQ